jgi:hypothetical protein
MHNFVIQAMAAVWAAYHKYADMKNPTPEETNTRSWLYDAASLLEILSHDERLLAIYDDYYRNSQKLPWNRLNDYSVDSEPSQAEVERLFNIWADFNDEDSPPEVTTLVESKGLGPVDSVSFMAFCNAWEKSKRTMENKHETVCG